MEMGTQNMLTELVEAHRVNQLFRLGKTLPGRAIFSQLNLTPIHVEKESGKSPPTWRSLIDVCLLLKNMRPTKHKGRREPCAKVLNKVLQNKTPKASHPSTVTGARRNGRIGLDQIATTD